MLQKKSFFDILMNKSKNKDENIEKITQNITKKSTQQQDKSNEDIILIENNNSINTTICLDDSIVLKIPTPVKLKKKLSNKQLENINSILFEHVHQYTSIL